MRSIAIAAAAVALAASAAAAQHDHHPAVVPSAVPSAVRPVSRADGARVLDVEAMDFAFRAADTVEAGYTVVRMVNRGAEPHHVALLRLDGGKTLRDLYAALAAGGPPPAWVHDVGGPGAVVPGDTSRAAVELEPGRYVLLCFIDGADHVMHAKKGMARELVVVPARTRTIAARPVVPDAEVTLDDYRFDFARPLARGRQLLRVRNAAAQAHEIVIFQLAPGKSADDLAAFMRDGRGAPPGRPVGGTTGIARGGYNDVTLDLAPGEYALLCFYPDARDGRPHTAHGMMTQVTVR